MIRILSSWAAPLTGIVLTVVVAVSAGLRQHAHNRELREARFRSLAERATAQLVRRLQIFEYGLRGAHEYFRIRKCC